MKKLPKIGQRVVVKDNYTWDDAFDVQCPNIVGQIGTVHGITDDVTLQVLVKFDSKFSDNLFGSKGRCWWLDKTHLRKVK